MPSTVFLPLQRVVPGSTEICGSGKPGAMEHAPRGKGMRTGDLVEGCEIGSRRGENRSLLSF